MASDFSPPAFLCQTVTAGSSSQEKEKDKTSDGDTNAPPGDTEKSHSNSSTLSDRRPSDSSLCSIEEEHKHVYDMVHCILLSTRDNVNFVNEVFHQVQQISANIKTILIQCTMSPSAGHMFMLSEFLLQFHRPFCCHPVKPRQPGR